MKKVFIVIPSFEPDDRLISLCNDLYKEKFNNVIIVNDGSDEKYDNIFNKIEKKYKYTILKHCVNWGKGRALKTAFNYLLTKYEDIDGCITIDSDGQHTIKDMNKCLKVFDKNPKSLILGCRSFEGNNVPLKSKFGNNITKFVFKFFCGLSISDTQTGLRAIPKEFMKELLNIKGERFEFETNMLIENNKYPIIEVEINTIYDSKENHSIHFRPIVDSFKIYKTIFKIFFKYIISSLSSFIIDILIFALFISIFKTINSKYYIIISTIIARVISSIYNYTINKRFVFNSNIDKKNSMFKYFSLVIIQMFLSAYLVKLFVNILIVNEVVTKIFIDTTLFFISFFIQKKFIFKKITNK